MEESNIKAMEFGSNSRTDWPTIVFGSSVRCIGRVIIYLQSKGGNETCSVARKTDIYVDHHTFRGICRPSPPLSQHFALVRNKC